MPADRGQGARIEARRDRSAVAGGDGLGSTMAIQSRFVCAVDAAAVAYRALVIRPEETSLSKSLRLSEKWFRRGLWLVALVFAGFLVGLGDTFVRNLPRVESVRTLDEFVAQPAGRQAREAAQTARRTGQEAKAALEQAEQQHKTAVANSRAATDALSSHLATRHVTGRPDQDPELIARRDALEVAKKDERVALAAVEAQQQIALDARQAEARSQQRLRELEDAAREAYDDARMR